MILERGSAPAVEQLTGRLCAVCCRSWQATADAEAHKTCPYCGESLPAPRAGSGRSRTDASLPVEPLQRWLGQILSAADGTLKVAAILKIDTTYLRRLLLNSDGATGRTLALVDELVTRWGDPSLLARLYPVDEPMFDRWCSRCAETVTVGDDGRCPWCETRTCAEVASAA